MKGKRFNSFPELSDLKAELRREKQKQRYMEMLRDTLYTLIAVLSFSVLVATAWIPILRIHGTSMEPTLENGQYVIAVKGSEFEKGDSVAFYIGSKLLVKRVIAGPGDTIDIQEDGTVILNGEELNEPYIKEKALGECDMEFPYEIPASRYFLMGDNRADSVDSRSDVVGCVASEQIVGKIAFCIWPLFDIGLVD